LKAHCRWAFKKPIFIMRIAKTPFLFKCFGLRKVTLSVTFLKN
jgi:hypothetical protein